MPRFAAIDIGSNSIRLLIADAMKRADRLPDLQTHTIDREVTRLGEGVYRQRQRISTSAMRKTLRVLAKWARECEAAEVVALRAVATSAVRDAKNQFEFVKAAQEILGVPVEVVTGPEEAQLVHLGVHARWPQPMHRKSLILDIGGGSAQLIYGGVEGILDRVSRPLGAVRLREFFLERDPPKKSELRSMNEFIDEKLAVVAGRIPPNTIDQVIATSATAAAVVCAVHRIRRQQRDDADRLSVSAGQVKALYQKLSTMDLEGRRGIRGIGSRRAEVIVPGIAVLKHVLAASGRPTFTYSSAGVRDGIVVNLAMRSRALPAPREEPYHVFLCHHSKDKPWVKEIAEQLHEFGIVPFLDERGLTPGLPWRAELERQLKTSRSAAVFIGAHGLGAWQERELDVILDTFDGTLRPVIPVLLRSAPPESKLPPFLRSLTAVDFRVPDPDPLQQLIRGIPQDVPELARA
jgi:exopolyphosphatase/pppGpp-phosphohydrolase